MRKKGEEGRRRENEFKKMLFRRPALARLLLLLRNQEGWTAFHKLADDSPKLYWKLILSLGKVRCEIEQTKDTAGKYTVQDLFAKHSQVVYPKYSRAAELRGKK